MTTTETTTSTVWVLSYWHRHGTDLSVHATQEGAEAAIADIVHENWDDLARMDEAPEMPEDDDMAVSLYFERMGEYDEGHEIQEFPVQT